ncbi:MAG: WecB/TagA/CpsF family glycosyltransferase [Tannerella sp.]|jgi:N-acetylglucosaminyldiphosphoundecaprenol N-acetyl-beta-D-mannosaminyltransferase|nr:WecB/TagA/CpsF family glycosyltransferase [Tannerella sp.]
MPVEKKKYFNVFLEFDADLVDKIIQTTIETKGKGYVCSIESNNLTYANKHADFNEVVNNALVNICDGSNLAWLLGKIHHKHFRPYVGADLFIKYVKMRRYRQYFLGNTRLVLDGLKKELSQIDSKINTMPFEELPFLPVNEFNYPQIGAAINREKPDIVWISLGAPKQEQFMKLLLPYLEQGVMFGFGAIFNFNAGGVGAVKRAPRWMQKRRLEWLYRAFEEPKKNIPRYWNFIKILPKLVYREYRNK